MSLHENYRLICAALTCLREEAGLSREALADFFGTDPATIEGWESGLTEPTISECLVLSRLYGVPVDEMFPGFDPVTLVPEAYREDFAHRNRSAGTLDKVASPHL